MDHYYLYSVQICDVAKPSEFVLTEDSGPEDIILRGKLAARFFEPPVRIRLYPCTPDGEYVLCTIKDGTNLTGQPQDILPETWLLGSLGNVAQLWKDNSSFMLTHQDVSLPHLLHNVNEYLADINPGPPYIPCLHAEIHVRPPHEREFVSGEVASNRLTYNCFLLSCFPQLREAYIDEMIMRAGADPYIQDIPKTANVLATAINQICFDKIVTLAVVEKTHDRLFGRLNIPRGGISPQDTNYTTKDLRTLWDATRFALKFLENEHPDSALVTVWAGRTSEGNNEPEYALPLGFVAGAEWRVLKNLMNQEQLKPLISEIQGQSKSVRLRVLWPNVKPPKDTDRSTLIIAGEHQLTHLIQGMELQLSIAGDFYPGPYELDFQGTHDKPLLIRQKNAPRDSLCRQIYMGQHKVLYEFLLTICLEKGEIVTHEQLARIFNCDVKDIVPLVDNQVRKVLRKSRRFSVNPKEIFKNVKKIGWQTTIDQDQVLHLPRSVKGGSFMVRNKEGDEKPLIELLGDERAEPPEDRLTGEDDDPDEGEMTGVSG
jgi:hypothetical protein